MNKRSIAFDVVTLFFSVSVGWADKPSMLLLLYNSFSWLGSILFAGLFSPAYACCWYTSLLFLLRLYSKRFFSKTVGVNNGQG